MKKEDARIADTAGRGIEKVDRIGEDGAEPYLWCLGRCVHSDGVA